MNPIFANFSINAVKISQDFWFYFTKQVSFCMRDDSLWANGAKVWLFESLFGGISFCSWNLLFPCARSLWVHGGLPMDPIATLQDINAVDRPCKTIAKIPKISKDYHIILGYGKGDSRLVPPIKNGNSLLRAAPSIFWEDPAKFMSTPSMSANMFGAWWAFAVASNLRLNKQTHPPWISAFLHCGT